MAFFGSIREFLQRVTMRVVDFAEKWPWVVVTATLALAAGFGLFAQKTLVPRTDLTELLPRSSAGFRAYEHQAGRLPGSTNIAVIVESPSPEANAKFIDAVSAKVDAELAKQKACIDKCNKEPACVAACGPDLMSYMEANTKDVRKYYEDNKWLYATKAELEEIDETLDRQIALQSGMVENLEDDEKAPAPKPSASAAPAPPKPSSTLPALPAPKPTASATTAAPAPSAAAPAPAASAPSPNEKQASLGLKKYKTKFKKAIDDRDKFPTGYFASEDRKAYGLRIITKVALGGAEGKALIAKVEDLVRSTEPEKLHPELKWGLGGSLAQAEAEKESLLSDAVWASLAAAIIILGGVIIYFRSPWSLFVIILPVLLGVSAAYAFAAVAYGYVNTAGLFLGAIILGNGINYPIVLLSRYREFVATGMTPHEARQKAVWNAFRAEFVGAAVAAIAYGSLSLTQFRGFSQFGSIGFVGMLLVWLAIIPTVPATIVVVERIQARLPSFLRDPKSSVRADGSSGPIMRFIASATERAPLLFVIPAFVATAYFAYRAVPFLKDPWEYNFGALSSQKAEHHGGVNYWSSRGDAAFHGANNLAPVQILADSVEQVAPLKKQIMLNDAKDPQGRLVEEIITVWDMLPGTEEEQKQKLELIDTIRGRLTPGVRARLSPEEQADVDELKPPDALKVVEPENLPPFIKRRFTERDGRLGTVMYFKLKVTYFGDAHSALRLSETLDNVKLPTGQTVQTATYATVFAEMMRSLRRDVPLASLIAFFAVAVVVIFATGSARGALVVLTSLLVGVIATLGGAAIFDVKLHYVNFIALPITFGIGCEYPFNVYDRSRILKGDITTAVRRTAGAVALCSFTTTVGYGALLYNDFGALISFGKLAVAGEIACIIAALFVVPSLLHLTKKRDASGAQPPPPKAESK
ncbi:MAG: MMPL family transporter [Polyangiaceae bacterium]